MRLKKEVVRDARRLSLGRVAAAAETVNVVPLRDMFGALACHATGNWGAVDERRWAANDRALRYGGRVVSCYHTARGRAFWIVTNARRSATMIGLEASR